MTPPEARVAITAQQITADEQVHVAHLRTALGSAAVAKPAIKCERRRLLSIRRNGTITRA